MSKLPFLSIAITTYDRKDLLIETINSVLTSSDIDYEVIIGNDNVSRTVDAHFTGIHDPRILYINNERNLGFCENTRNLYRLSRGEYFTSLSDDDLLSPFFFSEVITAIETYNRPKCIYTNFTEDYDTFRRYRGNAEVREMSGRFSFDAYIKQNIALMGNCGVFKKEFLGSISGMVQWNTWGYLDTFMAFYNMIHADKVIYIDSPLIYYRDHAGSLSSNVLTLEQWMMSQQEFVNRTLEVISDHYVDKRSEYLFYLLGLWCVPSMFARFIRLGGSGLGDLSEYVQWLFGYFPNLHQYKLRFIVRFAACLLKLGIKHSLPRPLIRRFINAN